MSEPEAPPFPDELLSAAAEAAGGWVYAIDPAYDPDGRVPPEGVAGAWAIGTDGRPTGEFRHNPNYEPSEMATRLRDLGEGGPPAGRMPDGEPGEGGPPADRRDPPAA
jgi:hypothetical protein